MKKKKREVEVNIYPPTNLLSDEGMFGKCLILVLLQENIQLSIHIQVLYYIKVSIASITQKV